MNQKPDPSSTPVRIPIPLWRRWREFRIRVLPVLVFLGTAFMVGHLWQGHVAPTQVSGFAVAQQFDLRSPRDGYVMDVQINVFSTVDAGTPIARIQPTDLEELGAQIAILQAEISAIQASLGPVTGLQRTLIDYEELRLEKMKTRVQLAAERVDVSRLEREAKRQDDLFAAGLATEAEHDTAVTRLEVARVRIQEQESLLESLEQRLTNLASAWDELEPDMDVALLAAIQVKEEEIRRVEKQIEPFPIYSPVNGMIAALHHANGSYTQRGDIIATVHASEVDYVMGYLRHPVRSIPEVGSEVHVLVPSRNQWFTGIISTIGNQMVPIHDMLARTGIQAEYALPLRIEIAPDSPVLPGERIEIRL